MNTVERDTGDDNLLAGGKRVTRGDMHYVILLLVSKLSNAKSSAHHINAIAEQVGKILKLNQ